MTTKLAESILAIAVPTFVRVEVDGERGLDGLLNIALLA